MNESGRALAIADLAEGVIDHLGAYWAARPDAVPLPGTRIILAGEPRGTAWDCEQLTVALEGIGWGPAEDASAPPPARPGSAASALAIRHAVLVVQLVRCTPNSGGARKSAPSPEALNAAGLAFLKDAGLMSQAMVEYTSRFTPAGRPLLPMEASVQMGTVDPIGPSGGFHGLETTIVITASRLE